MCLRSTRRVSNWPSFPVRHVTGSASPRRAYIAPAVARFKVPSQSEIRELSGQLQSIRSFSAAPRCEVPSASVPAFLANPSLVPPHWYLRLAAALSGGVRSARYFGVHQALFVTALSGQAPRASAARRVCDESPRSRRRSGACASPRSPRPCRVCPRPEGAHSIDAATDCSGRR
jgi:hypothetical protein